MRMRRPQSPCSSTAASRRYMHARHTRACNNRTHIVLLKCRVHVEVPADSLRKQRRLVCQALELHVVSVNLVQCSRTWCACLSAAEARCPSCHATRL